MLQLLYGVVHQYQNTSTALILLENWGLRGNIILTDRDTLILLSTGKEQMKVRDKQTDKSERIQPIDGHEGRRISLTHILSNPECASLLTRRERKHSRSTRTHTLQTHGQTASSDLSNTFFPLIWWQTLFLGHYIPGTRTFHLSVFTCSFNI